MLVSLLACVGAHRPDLVPDDDEQGIVVTLRTLEGDRVETPEVQLGGTSFAVPDAAGLAYFFGVPPGRTPVASRKAAGAAPMFGHADVPPIELATTRLVPLPLVWRDEPDATTGSSSDDDEGLTVGVPPGALALDGVAAEGAWRLGWGIPASHEQATVPGDHLGQLGDADVHPIHLHAALAVQAVDSDGELLGLLPDQLFTVTMPVDDGSPLLAGTSRLYSWAHSRGYWVDAGSVTADDDDGTVSFETSVFGWFGLGEDAGDLGCVVGLFTDGVAGRLSGMEVRSEQDGAVAPDRTTSIDGAFCVVAEPGTAVTLTAAGFDSDRSRLFTWAGGATVGPAGECGSAACTDVGVVAADVWLDADEDRAFAGPGGDCDDGDPDVNPSPAFGDGSFCGGSL